MENQLLSIIKSNANTNEFFANRVDKYKEDNLADYEFLEQLRIYFKTQQFFLEELARQIEIYTAKIN